MNFCERESLQSCYQGLFVQAVKLLCEVTNSLGLSLVHNDCVIIFYFLYVAPH